MDKKDMTVHMACWGVAWSKHLCKKAKKKGGMKAHRKCLKEVNENPNGLKWHGAFDVKLAVKQKWCCVATAKECGSTWVRLTSQLRKSWSTPSGLKNVADTAIILL